MAATGEVSKAANGPASRAEVHIPELDALRGVASFGVVLFHAFPYVFFFGWSFVDCFFVLSGYLITNILLRNVAGRDLLRAFYFRRALRIWPVYYATLAALLVLNALSRTGWPTTGLVQHLFFCQNLQHLWRGTSPPFIAPFSPSWSVAVEEQFYLCWPLILVAFGPKAVRPVAVGLVIVATIYQLLAMPIDTLGSRGDALAAGCLLASCDLRGASTRALRTFLAVGVLALVVVMAAAIKWWGNPEPPPWGYVTFPAFSVLYVVIVGASVRFSGHPILAPLRWRPLRALGLISYSLYLLHLPILTYAPALLVRCGLHSVVAQRAAVWILIFALPTLSYFLIERPALSLKRLLAYSGNRSATRVVAPS